MADPFPESESESGSEPEAQDADSGEDDLSGPDDDPEDDRDLATSAVAAPGPAAVPVPVQAAVPAPGGAPGLDPALLDSIENGDTQLMMPVPEPQVDDDGPTVSQDSMVMAVVCPYGHSNPDNASQCRVCGTPIAPQGPQLVARPALALLRTGDGVTVEVDRPVLLGRAPSAQQSTARSPRLVTVPSPGHDISRTHVEVAPDGWQIVVTDLRSTNGTVLVRPGSGDRQQLPAGEPVAVPLQSLLELGDGVSVLIDFPQ